MRLEIGGPRTKTSRVKTEPFGKVYRRTAPPGLLVHLQQPNFVAFSTLGAERSPGPSPKTHER